MLGLDELQPSAQAGTSLVLTVEDSGPGIPDDALEEVFQPGFSTASRKTRRTPDGLRPIADWGFPSAARSWRRRVGAFAPPTGRRAGARIEIELPVRDALTSRAL